MAAFSQFSTDLDPETRHTIERGQRLTELLKQLQFTPYSIWEMYSSLYAASQGAFDEVPVEKVKQAEAAMHRELKSKHKKLTETINTGDKPTDTQNAEVLKVAKSVTETYKPAKKAAKE